MAGCTSTTKMLLAWQILANFKKIAQLICVFITTAFLPVLWLVTCPLRILSILLFRLHGNKGKIIGHIDAILDEDFANRTPKSSIISTLELDGDITGDEVREIFRKNVLDAKIKSGKLTQERYPEFRQYYTSFFGFRFRKNDPNFKLENHIYERVFDFCDNNNDKMVNIMDLSTLHEQLVNEKFDKRKSPWELYIIRNVILMDDLQESESRSIPEATTPKTVLALRMHHTMGDAKSLLKLIVECLGQKPIKSAVPQSWNVSFLQKTWFYGLLPLYYISFLLNIFYLGCRSHLHQWKTSPFDNSKMAFKFSKKIYINDLKNVAKKNSVTTSAVLISAIAGAVRKCDPKAKKEGITFGYILPKDNHPKHLANHLFGSASTLPSDVESPKKRLEKSYEIFTKMRRWEYCTCGDLAGYFLGGLPLPSTNPLALNHYSPLAVTNVAGELEGFSVGGLPCSGFRLSVGVMPGSGGLVFCIFSYKDSLRIGLTGVESAINARGVEKLVEEVGKEFEILKSA